MAKGTFTDMLNELERHDVKKLRVNIDHFLYKKKIIPRKNLLKSEILNKGSKMQLFDFKVPAALNKFHEDISITVRPDSRDNTRGLTVITQIGTDIEAKQIDKDSGKSMKKVLKKETNAAISEIKHFVEKEIRKKAA